jgi:hypothetical protein
VSAVLIRAICVLGLLNARRLKAALTIIENMLRQQYVEESR